MPFYSGLNSRRAEDKFIIDRLLTLRSSLDRNVPQRSLHESLLLATWNIREFDSGKYGKRTRDAYYFIAEIIARFDLVAVQEVNRDLTALKEVLKILGGYWDYLVTDVTEGSRGNQERMAFLYDSRKVKMGGLASEITFPPKRQKDADGKTIYMPQLQVARTPFMVGFQAGWSRFILVSVHILYGSSDANDPRRVEEIGKIAEFINKRSQDDRAWARNFILLGDFNIFKKSDDTFKALTGNGFKVPDKMMDLPTNIGENKIYDQIAFRVRKDRFADEPVSSGVYRFFQSVFRAEDEAHYAARMGKGYTHNRKGRRRTKDEKSRYYRDWRTHQMSDHYPMWAELKIDYSDEYLERLKAKS
ncbi:MAG: endonuclease/exonuclease/phosphatase [Chloroflexi bacterium]|nr:MAG: endonuclease/exonuclease/phosphatase [Chloroflexota bacterium]MBL1193350.1 endonuclease/exonuclease/phosphatase [Chloroflexota bacterium]NOH10641.1 endonuclease/exonuclease/phosphatase family protein [Chloroflexota bacterium]